LDLSGAVAGRGGAGDVNNEPVLVGLDERDREFLRGDVGEDRGGSSECE